MLTNCQTHLGGLSPLKKSLTGSWLFFLVLFLSGCTAPAIITGWKAEPVYSIDHFRILVVGIFKEEDSLLRKDVEEAAKRSLEARGYIATTAIEHFGTNGLAGTIEEETYLKLCNAGVDAVMTFALVPSGIEHAELSGSLPNSYYFQRLWSYRNLDQAAMSPDSSLYLESIFFDLMSLQALSVMYTKPFESRLHISRSVAFPQNAIDKMVKEKVLKKRVAGRKGF